MNGLIQCMVFESGCLSTVFSGLIHVEPVSALHSFPALNGPLYGDTILVYPFLSLWTLELFPPFDSLAWPSTWTSPGMGKFAGFALWWVVASGWAHNAFIQH